MAGEGTSSSLGDASNRLRAVPRDRVRLTLTLSTGDVRHVRLGTHTGSIGNALDRLEDWIETEEGPWIHKRWIVEAAVATSFEPAE